MKIINPERQNVTGSTATSSDTNFPLTNLFNNHPRDWWKANATHLGTLRLKIDAGANGLGIYSTNADTVTCTITADADEQNLDNAAATDEGGGLVGIPCTGHGYSSGGQVLINGSTNYDGVHTLDAGTTTDNMVIPATYSAETFAGTETVAEVQSTEDFDLRVIDTYAKLMTDDPDIYRQFWMDFTYQSTASTATIEMAAVSGTVLRAGVYKAGVGINLPNPYYGLEEGRKDYSVKKQLNNGARYIRKRNVVRTFSGEILLERTTRASEFYYFMDVVDQQGPNPIAFLLIDDVDDKTWTVYGYFESSLPKGKHSLPKRTRVSFTIEEAI